MSPHDRNDDMRPGDIRPEEERALDALIASQTDTSLEETTADRLLSFLDAAEPVASIEKRPAPQVTVDGQDQDRRSEVLQRRRSQPLRIAGSIAVALALGAAALLLFHTRNDAPADAPTDGGPVPKETKSPYIAHEPPPPEADKPALTLAISVTGWGKKRVEKAPSADPILAAWSGDWVAGLDTEDLLVELRAVCAALQPWPLASSRSGIGSGHAATRKSVLEPVLASSDFAGTSKVATQQQRLLLGTTWLLSRVENGSLSRDEALEPARILFLSNGEFRAELIECFRDHRIRFDKLLDRRSRLVFDPAAAICGALGSPHAAKPLSRATLRSQRTAIAQAVQTGDETSLGFAIDLLLRADRLTPQRSKGRIEPLSDLEGDSWRIFLDLLDRRAEKSSSHSERDFLMSLRGHLSSKS